MPFHCAKFQKKKILRVDPKLLGHVIFRPKITHLPYMTIFSEQPLKKFPSSLAPSLSLHKISKKSIGRIQSFEVTPALGPKWPVWPKR